MGGTTYDSNQRSSNQNLNIDKVRNDLKLLYNCIGNIYVGVGHLEKLQDKCHLGTRFEASKISDTPKNQC